MRSADWRPARGPRRGYLFLADHAPSGPMHLTLAGIVSQSRAAATEGAQSRPAAPTSSPTPGAARRVPFSAEPSSASCGTAFVTPPWPPPEAALAPLSDSLRSAAAATCRAARSRGGAGYAVQCLWTERGSGSPMRVSPLPHPRHTRLPPVAPRPPQGRSSKDAAAHENASWLPGWPRVVQLPPRHPTPVAPGGRARACIVAAWVAPGGSPRTL
jgi:hypothetical protein